MERTTLTLVQSLPGISRWFEVEKRELVSGTTSEEITILHKAPCNTLLFYRLQFGVLPANIQVLIQVITLNNNNDLGHEFGAIGQILFPPSDRLDVVLKLKLLCFDFCIGLLYWGFFF